MEKRKYVFEKLNEIFFALILDLFRRFPYTQPSKVKRNFVLLIPVFELDLHTRLFWDPLCIAASGNIMACGNISLKLFIAPLETIELLIFCYVVAEYCFAQL